MLGEQTANSMNYGSDGYGFCTLPLNKNALSISLSVFGMSNLSDKIGNVKMIGEDYGKTSDEIESIFQEVK